jgi:hypothetical protein
MATTSCRSALHQGARIWPASGGGERLKNEAVALRDKIAALKKAKPEGETHRLPR